MAEYPVHPSDHRSRVNDRLRYPEKTVVDQRQQQIDPAGKHRRDANERSDQNTKQPGSVGQDDEADRDD